MSNFVEDDTDLPYPKTDERPLAVGADPTQWVVSSDWNTLCQAAVDLRSFVTDPSNTVLPNTAVTPGSYTYSSLTVDQKGRLTAAVSGATPALASTSVIAGSGLSGGGTLAASRTIALANTAVTAGSYTDASITVDAQGRLTSAATGATPALAATSVLAGTGLSGGGTLAATRTINLADTAVTPGSYTLASMTVDQQGRLTAASTGTTNFGWFGDGSDGALSGSLSFGRDMFCTTFTGVAGDVVNLNGFRLFCTVALVGPSSGTFTLRHNGGPGSSGGVASAALAGVLGGSSSTSIASTTGNGVAANPTGTWPSAFQAGVGGAGGAGNGTTGSSGALIGTGQATSIGSFNQVMTAIQGRALTANNTSWTGGTAGGNGGGGAGSGGLGGTGGAGGGYAVVCAKSVTNPSHILIEAKGGAGGSGGFTGGATGGGGGGGGGYCVQLIGFGTPATQSAAGGAGGAGTSGGVAGSTGGTGKVVTFNLSA